MHRRNPPDALQMAGLEAALHDILAGIDADLSVTPTAVAVRLYRLPIDPPFNTVFGPVTNRPALIVSVRDATGAEGCGEIWCNFPQAGAAYRRALAADILPGLTIGQSFRNPPYATDTLTRRLRTLAIQAGEDGPFAQILAGLDVALWDLVATRARKPLYALFGGVPTVPVYASSIPPDEPTRIADAAAARGHTAFKLRVGFGERKDIGNLEALRASLGPAIRLMIDANQSWTADEAITMARAAGHHRVEWLEEPVPADEPCPVWRRIADEGDLPLAGGENVRGLAAFERMIAERAVKVLQPDVGKWGGISGGLVVGRAAKRAGLRFCPHWLAGGVGFAASLHLQAALGGDDLVEFDANPNKLRDLLCDPAISAGKICLPDHPGLGITPRLDHLTPYSIP